MNQTNIIRLPSALSTPMRTSVATGATSAEILPLDKFRQTRASAQMANTADSRFASGAASATDAPLTLGDIWLAGDIWDAITENRVVVHYQPQYDMRTRKTVSAEALVRLIDLDGQLIYPDRFIEMVEQSDLIVPLGRAVIEQVCADLAACRAEGLAVQRMAINLSARQLNLDTTLLEFIDRVVARHGLQHDDLEFELTERQSLSPNCAGIALLNGLAERGARIVIDDFGIGYSSIVYLTELPISAFKLDRALVNRLPEDRAMQAVVKNLLTLASDLGLEVVAEGIETPDQNEFLTYAGCHFAQGFGYAKPMPIDALRALLTNSTNPDESGFAVDV